MTLEERNDTIVTMRSQGYFWREIGHVVGLSDDHCRHLYRKITGTKAPTVKGRRTSSYRQAAETCRNTAERLREGWPELTLTESEFHARIPRFDRRHDASLKPTTSPDSLAASRQRSVVRAPD